METGRAHPFFEKVKCESITEKSFDQFLSRDGLKILFLWGHQCPNCEIAKNVMTDRFEELSKYDFYWADCNVYEYMEVGKRFGIHGIPVFMFFNGQKVLGKVSPFPGWVPFAEVLEKIQKKHNELAT